MMRISIPTLSCMLALLTTAAPSGFAEGSGKPPLERYAPLWAASPLTEKPVRLAEAAGDPEERLLREIEQLKKRVTALELSLIHI